MHSRFTNINSISRLNTCNFRDQVQFIDICNSAFFRCFMPIPFRPVSVTGVNPVLA